VEYQDRKRDDERRRRAQQPPQSRSTTPRQNKPQPSRPQMYTSRQTPLTPEETARLRAMIGPNAQSNAKNLRQNMPSAAFINGSGNALSGPQGRKNLRDNVTSLVNDHGANTLYVPILTSDGRVGVNTTGDRKDQIYRDRKYEEVRTETVPSPWGWLGRPDRTRTMRYPRDVVDETRDAVNSTGRQAGKGQNDVKVVPWIESAFTTYVGRDTPKVGNLRNPAQVNGFTADMGDAILTRDIKDSKGNVIGRVPIEVGNENGRKPENGSGNAYLDPLDPKVQANIRQVIGRAASKDYVSAVMVDDHFGIPLDKPEVRGAILARHPVPPNYRDAKSQAVEKELAQRLGRKPTNEQVQQEVENGWLRDQFTAFVNDVKAELKPRNVELWASTNMPDGAKRNQGQDIERWIRTGLVDNWNVQLYRQQQGDFQTDFNRLQRQASQIPQVANGQVPLSVAVSAYAGQDPNGKPHQLRPEEMAQRVNYAENPTHQKVRTTTAAFDEGAWLRRIQEQNQSGEVK
jgi:hypothetical protein